MARHLCVSLLALVSIAVASRDVSAAPLLEGQTVQYQYLYPCIACVYDDVANGLYVVGAGPEVSLLFNTAALDISDTNLYLDFVYGNRFTPASFNGFSITDVFGVIPGFTFVTINPATTFGHFDRSRVSWDADHVWVNLSSLRFTSETVLSLDVHTEAAPLPEPGTLVLFAAGGIGVIARLRRRARVTVDHPSRHAVGRE